MLFVMLNGRIYSFKQSDYPFRFLYKLISWHVGIVLIIALSYYIMGLYKTKTSYSHLTQFIVLLKKKKMETIPRLAICQDNIANAKSSCTQNIIHESRKKGIYLQTMFSNIGRARFIRNGINHSNPRVPQGSVLDPLVSGIYPLVLHQIYIAHITAH